MTRFHYYLTILLTKAKRDWLARGKDAELRLVAAGAFISASARSSTVAVAHYTDRLLSIMPSRTYFEI
jgi:hypothetical protein